jgi:hypothetical protein
MTATEVLISIAAGLAVNECCDVSLWLADRLVRRAARLRYGASGRAAVRAEEWTAIIHERPGKLLKLVTAIGFVVAARFHRATIRARKSIRTLPRWVALTVVPVAIAGIVADVMVSAVSLVSVIPLLSKILPFLRGLVVGLSIGMRVGYKEALVVAGMDLCGDCLGLDCRRPVWGIGQALSLHGGNYGETLTEW